MVGLSVAVVLGCGRGLRGGKRGAWGRERGGGAEEGGLRRREGGMVRAPGGGGLRVRLWSWREKRQRILFSYISNTPVDIQALIPGVQG